MQRTWNRTLALVLLGCTLATLVMAAPAFAQASASPAANIASRLGSRDNPIVSVYDYNQANDPEGLLGLPGAYTSKAYFIDANSVEGYVEAFRTTADARVRKATLDQSAAGYSVAVGQVVLRVNGGSDSQDAYRRRLESLLKTS
jgi:hypothetical protein